MLAASPLVGHGGAMTELRSTIRGAEIAYEISGSGTNVIWAHGLSQSRATESLMPLLDWSRIDAHLLRYDARGHGASETTADLDGYSWDQLARDQLALADHVGFDRYVCAGASMGCGTALWTAVHGAARIAKLLLVIPPTGWETRAQQAEVWETIGQMIESGGVSAMVEARAELAPPDPFVGDSGYRDRQSQALQTWAPERLALAMRGAGRADLPPRAALEAIAAPTLILAWTGDPTHPMSTADELARLIPDATIHRASTRAELDTWTGVAAAFIG